MPAKTKKAANAPSTSSKPSPPDRTAAQSLSKPATSPSRTSKIESGPGGQVLVSVKTSEGAEPASKSTDNAAILPALNRNRQKKQKRREKEAAKKAAEQRVESDGFAQNGYAPSIRGPTRGYFREETEDLHHGYRDEVAEGDDTFFSGAEDPGYGEEDLTPDKFEQIGQVVNGLSGKKKKKHRKAAPIPAMANNPAQNSAPNSAPILVETLPPLRAPLPSTRGLSAAALRSAHQNLSQDQIWNTSTQAERENIKQFWLELGEEERRSLVKVEKEAVLRKMKEQQKHSCSCTVCGRKRTAIEEELEVLYDAYYEELEQFANHNHDLANGAAVMSDSRAYGHLRTPRHPMAGQFPLERTGHDPIEDDEDLDEEEYDDDEEAYSDDDIEQIPRGPPDFFTFGNSLTVKDGILTVADDLLKNDGKHFIDMMESLAEKRMQRHNHPPLDEDDDYDDDEEDDEDYDSQDEDELEADEMDAMTEEQRMEEGRRMFQIFAARMFEQRVLTAYREKVARERQRKLLEELEEETRLDTQREAKRAKEAAKRKEKKKMQKQAKDEEKAKREAEKAAQEAAARAIEEKRLEEQRQRKEEQRKKREAERKAFEEERLNREAKKQRKAQEERERQQELDRKQREAKEKEKKQREEARKREREEKEAKEREAKEREARVRKAKDEQQRKALEEQARKDREATMAAEREARDRARQEEQTRLNAKKLLPVAVPPGIHPAYPSTLQSPQFQVATPIIPAKAAIPARPRQPSQQGPQSSHGSSPRSQPAATAETTHSSTPSSTSITISNPPTSNNVSAKQQPPASPLPHPQSSAPNPSFNTQARSSQPPHGYSGMPGPSVNGSAPTGLGVMAGMVPQIPMYHAAPIGGPHRGYAPPNGISFPSGMNGNHGHFQAHTSMTPTAPIAQKQPIKSQPHSRQQSASYERMSDSINQPTPISRPAPIGQSSASTPDKKENRKVPDAEVEQLTAQLGSSALLEDSDIPPTNSDRLSAGAPGSGRAPFNNFHGAFSPNGVFAGSSNWGPAGLTPNQVGGWTTHHQPSPTAFGFIGGGGGVHATHRPHASRPVAIRLMVAEACRKLSATPGTSNDGFHPAQFLLRQLEQMKPSHEPPISLNEMLEICDTEGNAHNGGGNFIVRQDNFQGQSVKFEPGIGTGNKRSVGDIGSPMVAHSQLATFGGIGQPVVGANKAS